MTPSSPNPPKSGTGTRPSVLDAALHLTATDLPFFEKLVATLSALALSMGDQILSSDCMYLAINSARRIAQEKCGVTREEFDEIAAPLIAHWAKRRSRNPLSGMF